MIKIKKRKLLFGITSLTIGGAERVLIDIVNKLCDIYEITIFSIYDNGELKKELNPNIKFKFLYKVRYDELSKIQKMWIPIRILLFSNCIYKRRIKADYDTEIAFLEGPITRLFSNKNKFSEKIAWVHNDISLVFGNGFKSKLKKYIDKLTYKKYDKLVFVSNDNMKKFQEVYSDIDRKKMYVIYNYIDKKLVEKKADETIDLLYDESTNLVSVCRLVKQKAIDRFIKVHSRLIKNGVNHKVYIVGDGPEKEYLEQLIKSENVQNTFILLGKKENPYPYIKNADYFCLLSQYEGFGMVLEEAKILNKKIIITDTAARECIENYKNGVTLDNDEGGIYSGLLKILKDDKAKNMDFKYEYSNYDKIQKIIDLVGE